MVIANVMVDKNLGKTRIVVLCIVVMLTVVMLTLSGQAATQEATTTYTGELALPNPFNIAVGLKFTGKPCSVGIRHAKDGLWVTSDFWEGEKLVDGDALRGEDFYLGELDDNGAFVLQLGHGKPVTLTQTTYDRRGRLNYARRGSGNFLRECNLGYQ